MFDPIEAIREYCSHPSVSTDPAYDQGMKDTQRFIAGLFTRMGLKVEICPTARHAVVLARREGDPSWPHVVIYGHYDVQPPDPLNLWTTPAFEPQVRDGRLYARGAADNKGPQLVHIAAVARLLEKHPDLPLRITFLIEGEEEISSPNLKPFLIANRERLKGDFVLLSDTMSPSPEQIAITAGLRGIFSFDLRLTGPRTDLHSGIHGGALLNPIQALAELMASLHDAEGRVNVPGFYDGVQPVMQWERDELKRLGLSLDEYRRFLGVKDFHTFDGMTPFEATRLLPTLEFNGVGGGYQGEGSKTVIPSVAFAKVSCRLVPDMDPIKTHEKVVACLRERVSPKVTMEIGPGHFGSAYRVVPPGKPDTPADQPPILAKAFRAADKAIEQVFGRRPVYTREGGSVPIISTIREELGMDSVMIGMFTPQCNLHAPDESMHLGLFTKGIEASTRMLAEIAGVEP